MLFQVCCMVDLDMEHTSSHQIPPQDPCVLLHFPGPGHSGYWCSQTIKYRNSFKMNVLHIGTNENVQLLAQLTNTAHYRLNFFIVKTSKMLFLFIRKSNPCQFLCERRCIQEINCSKVSEWLLR